MNKMKALALAAVALAVLTVLPGAEAKKKGYRLDVGTQSRALTESERSAVTTNRETVQ